MSRADSPIKCCRCKFEHMESERVEQRGRRKAQAGTLHMSQLVCPRCGADSFYELREQVAWCWSSGLIEIGDAMPADTPNCGGAIEVARGPKYALKGVMDVVCRHGIGASRGSLLVPGVPEADTPQAKVTALASFLAWCGKRKPRDGVVFAKELA